MPNFKLFGYVPETLAIATKKGCEILSESFFCGFGNHAKKTEKFCMMESSPVTDQFCGKWNPQVACSHRAEHSFHLNQLKSSQNGDLLLLHFPSVQNKCRPQKLYIYIQYLFELLPIAISLPSQSKHPSRAFRDCAAATSLPRAVSRATM